VRQRRIAPGISCAHNASTGGWDPTAVPASIAGTACTAGCEGAHEAENDVIERFKVVFLGLTVSLPGGFETAASPS
jgi:hypothetical protein